MKDAPKLNGDGHVEVHTNGATMVGLFAFAGWGGSPPSIDFTGKIDSNGNAHGSATSSPWGNHGDWQLAAPLKCLATSASTPPSA